MPQAQQAQMSPQQQNAIVRQLLLKGGVINGIYYPPAVNMWQQLNPILPSGVGLGSVITIPLRNVGAVKRLIIEISATITAGASTTSTLTKLGLANLISNITFIDLGNNTRINSSGWHLNVVSSVKRRRVFVAAYSSDTPNGYGNINNRVMFAPATIAATTNSPVKLILEIPFVKNDHDLRGMIFADVTNATMQVQLTINPGAFVTSTADATLAVYQSGGTDLATISAITVQANQNYLDQLPRDPRTGAPILPAIDLGTAYLLNTTSTGLPVANQDNGIAFVNARSFESVAFIYDNNGTLNINGTDLNYIQVTSANFTQILRYDGMMAVTNERDILGCDFPAGMRYLDFRYRPINTDQYGNMQLIVNPSNVGGSAATIILGWEAFGIIGQVNQAGSLPMAA
jgi:hypothetical protein